MLLIAVATLPIFVRAMSTHPLNLALRFLLELTALFALGYRGWIRHDGILRVVLTFAVPTAAAGIWGVFSTPGDRSRSAKAIVPTPGIVRLSMELIFFAAAAWSFFATDLRILAFLFAGSVVLHYGLSYDRIGWLVKN
jgi:hypothetical protein